MRFRSSSRLEILVGLALVLAALWVTIGFLLHGARRDAQQNAEAAQRNVARSLAEDAASSVRAIDLTLRHLREDWQRYPEVFDAIVTRLEAPLARERVVQVAVVDAEGWVLYSRLPVSGRPNFADRPYFRVQKESGTDRLIVSEPVFGRITGRLAIQLSRPLRGADGRFAGIIVMAVPPPALELTYSEIHLGPHGSVGLFRLDGTVLALTGERLPGLTEALALGEHAPADGRFRLAGQPLRVFTYRRLDDYPLAVFVGQGRRAMLAPYYRQRNLLLGGGALASALLLALALLLDARLRERARRAQERERLMLELHDGCIQSIYAIGMSLEQIRRMLSQDPERAARAIGDAGANLNLVIQDLRAFIAGESGRVYGEADFMAEIVRMVPEPGGEAPAFTFHVDPEAVRRLSADQASHVLRIVREAISNVVRHASARRARVAIELRGAEVRVEVTDDGAGVAPQAGGIGLGLPHIRARAQKLGGRASIEAAPERGTRIAVEFPAGFASAP